MKKLKGLKMKLSDEEKIKVIQGIPKNAVDKYGIAVEDGDYSEYLTVTLKFDVTDNLQNREKLVKYFER